jgi:nitroreductase
MEFDKVLSERFSVREYKDIPVEEEKIQAILGAVRLAPTAKNSQPQKIYVAKTKEALEKVDLVTPNRFGAPVVIMVCGDKNKACILKSNGRNFLEVDATIIQTYMMLKATDLGLGSCWIGRFNAEKMQEVFNIPKNYIPYGILLVGYKKDSAVPSNMHLSRLEVEDFTVNL